MVSHSIPFGSRTWHLSPSLIHQLALINNIWECSSISILYRPLYDLISCWILWKVQSSFTWHCVRLSFWSSRWQPDGCGNTVEWLQTPASSWVVLLDRRYNPRHHNRQYRAGMAAAPNPLSRKCYSMADWLFSTKSVLESVPKSMCLTVLLRLSIGVAIHPWSPTHGLD